MSGNSLSHQTLSANQDDRLTTGNTGIITGQISDYSGANWTPILHNNYLYQIIHHISGMPGQARYYSPTSEQEFIDFGPNMGLFSYDSFYSASVESAFYKLKTDTNYYPIYRNSSGNPLWAQSDGSAFPSTLDMGKLIVYTDTTIEESYDTAPKDVSGTGLSFTTVGSTVEKVTLGGYPAYQFDGNGHFEVTANPRAWDGAGDMTIVLVVYAETVTERDTIFELTGGPYSSYQQSIAVTWETNGALSYYSRRFDNYDHAGTTTFTNNAWNMMAIKVTTGNSSTARSGAYSKNGAAFTTSYNSRSDTAIVRGNNIRVGSGYAGRMESCGLGALLLYNKCLSDTEISNLYDVIGPRFGLS